MKNYTLSFLSLFFMSCKSQSLQSKVVSNQTVFEEVADTTFVDLKNYSTDFLYDLKYATSNNFLKTNVYDCASCYLRYKTVKQLIKINQLFIQKGFRIKLFDCYRPLDVQKKMWKLVPNADYMANPNRGSVHNRGCAVDLTLVNKKGKELDMGTEFDFFGIEAGHSFQNLPKKILKNRLLLKTMFTENGFIAFQTEWWHYNLTDGLIDKLANFKWPCN